MPEYEQVFDDKRAYARKEAEIVHRELRSRLELLAKSVATAGPAGGRLQRRALEAIRHGRESGSAG